MLTPDQKAAIAQALMSEPDGTSKEIRITNDGVYTRDIISIDARRMMSSWDTGASLKSISKLELFWARLQLQYRARKK